MWRHTITIGGLNERSEFGAQSRVQNGEVSDRSDPEDCAVAGAVEVAVCGLNQSVGVGAIIGSTEIVQGDEVLGAAEDASCKAKCYKGDDSRQPVHCSFVHAQFSLQG